MKFGFRKPSLKKSLSARTSLKRKVAPKMPKGLGAIRNPKKALYNKVYNKTTISARGKGCALFFLASIVVMVFLCLMIQHYR